MNTIVKGKIAAILLSLAMVFTMMPMTAFADVNPYTVNVTASPSNGGTATVVYKDDGYVVIGATPNSGYIFVRWIREDGTEFINVAGHAFIPEKDCNLTAVFEEDHTSTSSYTLQMPNSITIEPYAHITPLPINVSALKLATNASGKLADYLIVEVKASSLTNQSNSEKAIQFKLGYMSSPTILDSLNATFDKAKTVTLDIVIANDQWKAGVYKGAIPYKVGYHYSDSTVEWVETNKSIPINVTVPGYTATVNNGTGSGEYAKGESVTVTANAPEEGKRFKGWDGADGLTFTSGSATTATATFTMPEEAVELTATYEVIPTHEVVVNSGTGSGSYLEGADVTVTANAPEEGKRFKEWDGADGLNFTSGSATTATATFTMPAAAVELAATYEDLASIQDAAVVLSKTAFTYNGKVQKPQIMTIGGNTLTEGTDYIVKWSNESSKNAGTYTVTIEGKGDYTGTTSATFTINPASIAEATVTGIENKVYTGVALEQTPEVKLGEVMLESGKDYNVSYNNNTNAGTATMTITGKGNYTGSISKTFTINKAVVKVVVPTGKNFTYNGKAQTGVAAGSNYTLSGTTKATNAGSYTATATLKTGDANSTYKWSDGTTEAKSIKWTINKANNPLAMKPKTATVKYKKLKKKAQPLAVTKVISFTKQLKDKKNYTLSSAKKGNKSFKKYFAINKTTGKVTVKKKLKKGTYKVQVKVRALGNANYKASALKTVTFKVVVK